MMGIFSPISSSEETSDEILMTGLKRIVIRRTEQKEISPSYLGKAWFGAPRPHQNQLNQLD